MTDQNEGVSHPASPLDRPPGGQRQLPVKNPYTGEVDYQITPPATPASPALLR